MDQLLIGAACFLLENLCSMGFDKGTEYLVEKLSNKTLLKADDRVREYLMDHLQEYEYEKIDSFLAQSGVYAHDQALTNWSILSAQTDELVNDFYKAHPTMQYNRQTLTPLLEQAIITAYQSVLSQLSVDGQVLYNQAIRNREQDRTEHKKIEDRLNSIEQLLSQNTEEYKSIAELLRDIIEERKASANIQIVHKKILWINDFSKNFGLTKHVFTDDSVSFDVRYSFKEALSLYKSNNYIAVVVDVGTGEEIKSILSFVNEIKLLGQRSHFIFLGDLPTIRKYGNKFMQVGAPTITNVATNVFALLKDAINDNVN